MPPEPAARSRREYLAGALTATGVAGTIRAEGIVPIDDAGISHDHLAVQAPQWTGPPLLLRIPRLSQWGLPETQQFAYERAAFARAEPSGVTPRIFAALDPSPDLPMGAYLVERIDGRTPRLPEDMPALARALAAIHAMPVPAPGGRPPLFNHADPVRETLKVIEAQAIFLDKIVLDPAARTAIETELGAARRLPQECAKIAPVVRLAGTDTHPGNFLIRPDGAAAFVDLEKMLYGAPAIDLAHATLYTSTMFDPDVAAALTPAQTADFHDAYFEAIPAKIGDAVRPWIAPARRLVWLRTLTWCIRWTALSADKDSAWSRGRIPKRLSDHVAQTVADYLRPTTIDRIRAEWAA